MVDAVYVLPPGENWIVDRFVGEWNAHNSDITTIDVQYASTVWLMSDWAWRQIPYTLLKTRKVLTTIHHIVPEKFDTSAREDFLFRDTITTAYHTPNEFTAEIVRKMTKKPVHVIPYWANQFIWRHTPATSDRSSLRRDYGIPESAYVVGSFQRDTEGAGILQGIFLPKLEKGPDLFVNYVSELNKRRHDVFVLLAGWRRQFVMSKLIESKIPHKYVELPPQEEVNELYQTLDVYPVTARHEGGPQSLIECGLLNVPVVSRDVGMARQVLPTMAIADNVIDATPVVPSVEHLKLPHGYEPYRELIRNL
jgi:glycosyltransferase involved in cell wall biosynthesis